MKDKILQGHVLEVLHTMPGKSVDMAITSPPYWGLRDYGTEFQIWDGNKDCQHDFPQKTKAGDIRFRAGQSTTVGNYKNPEVWRGNGEGAFCSRCGAWQGHLGLEPEYQLYINHLIQIFGEIKRILKSGGSLWVNIGDSYSGSNCGKGDYRKNKSLQKDIYNKLSPQSLASRFSKWGRDGEGGNSGNCITKINSILPVKSLCGIPERFMLAMIDDGWTLRNKIIWAKQILYQDGTTKGAVMPSSVKDRFNQSWEYLYFFTKSQKYYFNLNEARVSFTESGLKRVLGYHEGQYRGNCKEKEYSAQLPFGGGGDGNKLSKILARAKNKFNSCDCQQCRPRMGNRGGQETLYDSKSAAKEVKLGHKDFNTDWEYRQYIRAGKHYDHKGKEVGYRAIGNNMSWEREGFKLKDGAPGREPCGFERKGHSGNYDKEGNLLVHPIGKNPPTAWLINTECFKDKHFATFPQALLERPIKAGCPPGGLVLDPFMGSGTTALMAKKLGRHFVGIELSKRYIDIATKRLKKEIPLFL